MEHSTEFARRGKRRAAIVRGLRLCGLIAAVGVFHAACGGKTDATNRGLLPTADGGPDSSASSGSGGSNAGTGGALSAASGGENAEVGGALHDASSDVPEVSVPPCDAAGSYIDITDNGELVHLAYPDWNDACGECTGDGCAAWGAALVSCNTLELYVEACSGPNGTGACLSCPGESGETYRDQQGKTWDAELYATVPEGFGGRDEVLIDVDATLAVGDLATRRELPAHVHICATLAGGFCH